MTTKQALAIGGFVFALYAFFSNREFSRLGKAQDLMDEKIKNEAATMAANVATTAINLKDEVRERRNDALRATTLVEERVKRLEALEDARVQNELEELRKRRMEQKG